MRIAVICEYSGTVRDAFIKQGHDAVSFDIIDSDSSGPHIKGDAMKLDIDWGKFDLAICHPPCTHLAVSGMRWFKEGVKPLYLQDEALEFVKYLMDLPIDKIAIENPISIISTRIRKPDQIINPFQFGHPEQKKDLFMAKKFT